jgi:hypothetical protein
LYESIHLSRVAGGLHQHLFEVQVYDLQKSQEKVWRLNMPTAGVSRLDLGELPDDNE